MHHAYGPAERVPELLMAMRSSDQDTRHSALSRYYSAVYHQGDVRASTAASLPFVYELAADPAIPDRAAIVDHTSLIFLLGEQLAAVLNEHRHAAWPVRTCFSARTGLRRA